MMKLRPFFVYFGGKFRAAPHYPKPKFKRIVEPFAGSAGYSLRYFDHEIVLCEADPTLLNLWSWLTQVSSAEVRALPLVELTDDLRTTKFASIAPEARTLIGFWLNKGMTQPCHTPGSWMRKQLRPNSDGWCAAIRERVATQVEAIRHWRVVEGFQTAANFAPATFFVDPPYQGRLGERYKHHSIDYKTLGAWCGGLRGQVLVCENVGADWLPFRPFKTIKGAEGKNRTGVSHEALWEREQ